jgi:hypothetical protein
LLPLPRYRGLSFPVSIGQGQPCARHRICRPSLTGCVRNSPLRWKLRESRADFSNDWPPSVCVRFRGSSLGGSRNIGRIPPHGLLRSPALRAIPRRSRLSRMLTFTRSSVVLREHHSGAAFIVATVRAHLAYVCARARLDGSPYHAAAPALRARPFLHAAIAVYWGETGGTPEVKE